MFLLSGNNPRNHHDEGKDVCGNDELRHTIFYILFRLFMLLGMGKSFVLRKFPSKIRFEVPAGGIIPLLTGIAFILSGY